VTDAVLEAVVQAGDYVYIVRAEKHPAPNLEDGAKIWAVAREAFQKAGMGVGDGASLAVSAGHDVSQARSRDVRELALELWVPGVEGMGWEKEPARWIKPDGIVERIVLCEEVVGDEAVGVRNRFGAGTRGVWFWAELRCTGQREIEVRWLEGGHVVARRRHYVQGHAIIAGKLTSSSEHGLPVGWYRLEIVSSAGKEAELEFVVEPGKTGEAREE
jgi:hypothetical protein